MICVNHGNRMAVGNCSRCGQPICEECSVSVRGQSVCKNCVEELVSLPAPVIAKEAKTRKVHSPFWTLFFSFILPPGGNYMYLGLMKRGIFTMMAFFSSIYFVTITDSPMFAFLIPIIWLAALFDSLNIRRRMENGEFVEDGVSDIMSFFTAHKTPVIIFGIIAVVASLADGFMWYPFGRILRPLLLIAFGILMVKIFFNKKEATSPSSYEIKDANQ